MRAKPTKEFSVFYVDAVIMLASQVETIGKTIDGLSLGKHVTPVMQYDVTGADGKIIQALPGVVKRIKDHNPLLVFNSLTNKRRNQILKRCWLNSFQFSELNFRTLK
ncbi:hypothetical protein EPI10_015603 [Gossypium australe]|uniref:Uncharacterized protein n=1 Tax=Gossypium australe TaxID=47621 RepID=A0A5B6VL82_9ROSI|nr:hypothetical protein EPI10_015603 [Gossypium australe]